MARKKKKNKVPVLVTCSLLLGFALLYRVSFSWAELGKTTKLTNINIRGNRIIPDREILPFFDDIRGLELNKIDHYRINSEIEKMPFVAAARISRHYPSNLRIEILERKPLAIVNLDELMLLDQSGIVLPMVPAAYELSIPILSGFNPELNLYPIGKPVLSVKMKDTVKLLNRIREIAPHFFTQLSEITLNQDEEYILILTERPTRINLGDKAIMKSIFTLLAFDQTLHGSRALTDYQYLDMRYAKQIIAKEWS